MKLPDFTIFKPLDETRQRMKADISDNMPAVETGDPLTMQDLEAKKKAAAPAPQAAPAPRPQSAAPRPKAPQAAAGQRPVRPNVVKNITVHKHDLANIMLYVQMLIFVNIILGALVLYFLPEAGREAVTGSPMATQAYVRRQLAEYDSRKHLKKHKHKANAGAVVPPPAPNQPRNINNPFMPGTARTPTPADGQPGKP